MKKVIIKISTLLTTLVLAILLSKPLMDIMEYPVYKLHNFLFKTRVCLDYDCGFFCCGSGLIFIIHFLFFLPILVISSSYSKNQNYFLYLLTTYVGVSIGTLVYVITMS